MHRSHHVLRSAVGPISARINNVLSTPSPYVPPSEIENAQSMGQLEGFGTEYDLAPPQEPRSTSTATTVNTLQSPPFFTEPVILRDVRAIQSGVVDVFDALQTSDQMSPAELSLIKTVRETASDPEIMSKIVNNGSFQEFMTLYVPSLLVEQRQQIAESSSRPNSARTESSGHAFIDEYESEGETSTHRSSSSSATSDDLQFYESDYSDEESNFLRGRSRRMHTNDMDPNSVQQRALNRLNELCHQISPDFTGSPTTGWRTERSPSPVSDSSFLEPGVSKPTMEGPGMPGVPQQVPECEPPMPSPPPQWANPVYLFVVTACVIPITILAVTAVVYPSPKTWSLLKNGFRAVCNKILA